VEGLLARDNVVRVLDNLTTGKLANLSRVMHAIELYPGDLADLDFVRRVTNGAELVFHLAGSSDWPDVLPPSAAASHPDALATRHVLRAAWEAKVRRVIYASSLRAYGNTAGAFCSEDGAPPPAGPRGQRQVARRTGLHGVGHATTAWRRFDSATPTSSGRDSRTTAPTRPSSGKRC